MYQSAQRERAHCASVSCPLTGGAGSAIVAIFAVLARGGGVAGVLASDARVAGRLPGVVGELISARVRACVDGFASALPVHC